MSVNHHHDVLTIDKDSKAKEIQVSLSSTGIPADVRVALRKEHGAHLQPTTGQICHHLEGISTHVSSHVHLCKKLESAQTISRSCSCRAKASSLLSIQEAAATSSGVDPRIPDSEYKQIQWFREILPNKNEKKSKLRRSWH